MDPWARQELAGASLPDRRYLESLTNIAERLATGGEMSYSQAIGHDGRQAARRLFGNENVNEDGLLLGHCEQTAARCSGHSLVLAVQDTTVLDYTTHPSKKGLGPVNTSGRARGLMAHSVLMLSTDGQPLGVLGVNLWARGPIQRGPNYADRRKLTSEKESGKWLWGLGQVQRHAPTSVPVLLIQDREADVFAFLAAKCRANVDLLVRARWDRKVILAGGGDERETNLMAAASSAPVVATMTVSVPRAPNRPERDAVLTIRSTCATIKRPAWHTREKQPPRDITVVDALEEAPPDGEEPIHWMLITTMPVTTPADARNMVRYYALRWTIERFHYVLKSGCRAERVQIDDVDRLKKALAIYYLVAWRLMYLTYIARTAPDTPADTAMTADEIAVLTAATGRKVFTMADAILAIGILGGHEYYRNAPQPGPKRLWMGLRRLQDMTTGWMLAMCPEPQVVNQD